jgi:hypothetical protein
MYGFPKDVTLPEIGSRVQNSFSMAETVGWSSAQLGRKLEELVYTPLSHRYKNGVRKFPQRYYSYARGYADALLAALYLEKLEFCYLHDGVLYSAHHGSKRPTTEVFYQTGRGHILGNCPSGHVWKHKDKLWYDSKEIEAFFAAQKGGQR